MSPTSWVYYFQVLYLVSYVACHDPLKRGECKADEKEPWTYRGKNGPRYWGETYPTCNGNEQSPIAINSFTATRDPDLAKLSMNNYDIPVTKATIQNNGHTVQITPEDDVDRNIVVIGSTYRLLQFHFHWGDTFYRGAEHTLNRIQYAMEMHLVHQNDNGEIAVVGVFFQETFNMNSEIQTIIQSFPEVLYKGNQEQLTSNLNLNNLVPANPSSYYRYNGSLTTPDCAEGVVWSVLTNPLSVGRNQMAEFRKLYSSTKEDASPACKLSNNFRPIQPLNNRKVYRSE